MLSFGTSQWMSSTSQPGSPCISVIGRHDSGWCVKAGVSFPKCGGELRGIEDLVNPLRIVRRKRLLDRASSKRHEPLDRPEPIVEEESRPLYRAQRRASSVRARLIHAAVISAPPSHRTASSSHRARVTRPPSRGLGRPRAASRSNTASVRLTSRRALKVSVIRWRTRSRGN